MVPDDKEVTFKCRPALTKCVTKPPWCLMVAVVVVITAGSIKALKSHAIRGDTQWQRC